MPAEAPKTQDAPEKPSNERLEQGSASSSSKLCEIVVAYRYLHILEKEAHDAMVELAARRTAGDTFDFEKHIQETLKSLPKIKLDMKSIMNMPGISNLFSIFQGKK
jgi:hypothetical protein